MRARASSNRRARDGVDRRGTQVDRFLRRGESGLFVAEGRLNESEIHGRLRRVGLLTKLRFQLLTRLFISRARSGRISAELFAEGEEITILAGEGSQRCGWLGKSGLEYIESRRRIVARSRPAGPGVSKM